MASNVNGKNRRIRGKFTALPEVVLATEKYAGLSAYAVKLLVDIARQYNGRNNGDLQAAYSLMKKCGWRSKGTLAAATKELQQAGFIELTRRGGMNLGPNLWAMTWEPIHECKNGRGGLKTDANPTATPSRLYQDKNKIAVRNTDQPVRNTDQ